MKKKVLMLFLSSILLVSTVACNINENTEEDFKNEEVDIGIKQEIDNEEKKEAKPVVFDVTQFINISSQELVSIMGKPDEIIETTERGFTDFPCTLYDYVNHELGFVRFDLINDCVYRITINGELPYNSGDILTTLNVQIENEEFITTDDMYIKYQYPTNDIDLIHATIIDEEKDTYLSLSVEFDSQYFNEWPVPVGSTEPGEYRVITEDYVKSVLLSPNTASFPWFDWTYKKNDYYFLVESYVDAENAFGAEVRNYFTFIYHANTQSLVYAEIDGEVLWNDGYTPTDTLVKKSLGYSNQTEDNADNYDSQEIMLWTEDSLPITLYNENESIVVNNVRYDYEFDEQGQLDLFISFSIETTFENDFDFEYSLINESGKKTERTCFFERISQFKDETGALISDNIEDLSVGDYTIIFKGFSLGNVKVDISNCKVSTKTPTPIKLKRDNKEVSVKTFDYTFWNTSGYNNTCVLGIGFELISDKLIEGFDLNFSLQGKTTGVIRNYCIEDLNIHGDYGDYISFTSNDYGEPLPVDSYEIIFYDEYKPTENVSCQHLFSDWINEMPANCETDGYVGHYKCTICDKNFDVNHKEITEIVINKGHKYEKNICEVCNYTYYSGGLKFEISDDRTYCTVSKVGDCKDEIIYIPPQYKEKPVTVIGSNSFSNVDFAKEIVIPDSVTTIKSYAFQYHGIETIEIPNSVTIIEPYAFSNCLNLKNILLPNSIVEIEGGTFLNCPQLSNIVISNNVKTIGSEAFKLCKNLHSVTIPVSVTKIGSRAFYNCENLTEIIFKGTKEEWLKIEKGSDWDSYSGEYMIYCSDGIF